MSSAIQSTFGANLQSLRELRGLTQAELGKRAGLAAASISHFETGQRMPSLESLVKLADALGVSVDVLLGRASLESSTSLDPIFMQASKADARTLDTARRVMEALLRKSTDQL